MRERLWRVLGGVGAATMVAVPVVMLSQPIGGYTCVQMCRDATSWWLAFLLGCWC